MIDAHLHLWDLGVSAYPWLTPDLGSLHRTFTAEEARTELEAAGITQAILVQADDSIADSAHLLNLATADDFFAGVVGWLPLREPTQVRDELEGLTAPTRRALCGIRHLVHDEARDDFLLLEPVRESLTVLAEHRLVLDVPDAWPRHLDQVTTLAAAHPTLTIVIDHLGKPPRGSDDLGAWERALRAAAAHPEVRAKISGLHAPGQPYTAEALRPVVFAALEAFGPERVMYGGDWPIFTPFRDYRAQLAPVLELLDELTTEEKRLVLTETARATYGLGEEVTTDAR